MLKAKYATDILHKRADVRRCCDMFSGNIFLVFTFVLLLQ